MDGSEINSILFQALRGVAQLGGRGEATKKALLLATEAAAEIRRPDGEAAMEQAELEARAAREPLEEAAHLSRTGRHCYDMLARQVIHMKVLIEQGYVTEETTAEIAKWLGQLGATATTLAFLKLPECPEGKWYQEDMQ